MDCHYRMSTSTANVYVNVGIPIGAIRSGSSKRRICPRNLHGLYFPFAYQYQFASHVIKSSSSTKFRRRRTFVYDERSSMRNIGRQRKFVVSERVRRQTFFDKERLSKNCGITEGQTRVDRSIIRNEGMSFEQPLGYSLSSSPFEVS